MGIRAYLPPSGNTSVKIISRPYKSREGKHYVDYFAEIIPSEDYKIELRAYLDEARGMYYIGSNISANDDFTKAFPPQIASVAGCFTMTENLEEGVKRELGCYKCGDSEALVEVYKYNYKQLSVVIEGKTLADINQLWDKIREGNILPYKLQTTTNQEPLIVSADLIQTVDGLRKKLDWALDELDRADRIIASCNSTRAEWEKISRAREEFVTELKAKVAQSEQQA